MMNDDVNALDCRLRYITHRFHPKPSAAVLSISSDATESPQSSPDTNKERENAKNKARKEKNVKEEVRLVLQLVTMYICICKQETRSAKERQRNIFGKEYLLLQILHHWKLYELPVDSLEAFIVENLSALSEPLSIILESHPPVGIATPSATTLPLSPTASPSSPPRPAISHKHDVTRTPVPPTPPPLIDPKLPWVLEFSSELYTKVVHYTLQKMVQDTEKETPVALAHLWSGIKDNMEKEVSRRESIVIQHLASPNTAAAKVHDPAESKDVAFTCGHHMTRRALLGHIVPQLQQRLEQFPVPLPATTRLIVSCYKLKMIPLACPMCLYNYMREAVPSGDIMKAWQV